MKTDADAIPSDLIRVIEGNTLNLRETELVLTKGIAIGKKSLRERFEVSNHPEAISMLEYFISRKKDRFEGFLDFIGRSKDRSLSICLNAMRGTGKDSERHGYMPLSEATKHGDYGIEYLSYLARTGSFPVKHHGCGADLRSEGTENRHVWSQRPATGMQRMPRTFKVIFIAPLRQ
ncbi:MAG: hypothetical protein WCQ50_05970 [Spirochaetota bacterium]